MAYHINDSVYEVKIEKGKIKITEYKERFKGLFLSEQEIIYVDNYSEVREYLKEKNGGIEIC